MGTLTKRIRTKRSVIISLAIFALLFMSGFQTFVGAKTYELGAEQAFEACVQRSRAAERARCEELRPFWTRHIAIHSEHLAAVLNRTSASAGEVYRNSVDVIEHFAGFVARRARSTQRLAH